MKQKLHMLILFILYSTFVYAMSPEDNDCSLVVIAKDTPKKQDQENIFKLLACCQMDQAWELLKKQTLATINQAVKTREKEKTE